MRLEHLLARFVALTILVASLVVAVEWRVSNASTRCGFFNATDDSDEVLSEGNVLQISVALSDELRHLRVVCETRVFTTTACNDTNATQTPSFFRSVLQSSTRIQISRRGDASVINATTSCRVTNGSDVSNVVDLACDETTVLGAANTSNLTNATVHLFRCVASLPNVSSSSVGLWVASATHVSAVHLADRNDSVAFCSGIRNATPSAFASFSQTVDVVSVILAFERFATGLASSDDEVVLLVLPRATAIAAQLPAAGWLYTPSYSAASVAPLMVAQRSDPLYLNAYQLMRDITTMTLLSSITCSVSWYLFSESSRSYSLLATVTAESSSAATAVHLWSFANDLDAVAVRRMYRFNVSCGIPDTLRVRLMQQDSVRTNAASAYMILQYQSVEASSLSGVVADVMNVTVFPTMPVPIWPLEFVNSLAAGSSSSQQLSSEWWVFPQIRQITTSSSASGNVTNLLISGGGNLSIGIFAVAFPGVTVASQARQIAMAASSAFTFVAAIDGASPSDSYRVIVETTPTLVTSYLRSHYPVRFMQGVGETDSYVSVCGFTRFVGITANPSSTSYCGSDNGSLTFVCRASVGVEDLGDRFQRSDVTCAVYRIPSNGVAEWIYVLIGSLSGALWLVACIIDAVEIFIALRATGKRSHHEASSTPRAAFHTYRAGWTRWCAVTSSVWELVCFAANGWFVYFLATHKLLANGDSSSPVDVDLLVAEIGIMFVACVSLALRVHMTMLLMPSRTLLHRGPQLSKSAALEYGGGSEGMKRPPPTAGRRRRKGGQQQEDMLEATANSRYVAESVSHPSRVSRMPLAAQFWPGVNVLIFVVDPVEDDLYLTRRARQFWFGVQRWVQDIPSLVVVLLYMYRHGLHETAAATVFQLFVATCAVAFGYVGFFATVVLIVIMAWEVLKLVFRCFCCCGDGVRDPADASTDSQSWRMKLLDFAGLGAPPVAAAPPPKVSINFLERTMPSVVIVAPPPAAVHVNSSDSPAAIVCGVERRVDDAAASLMAPATIGSHVVVAREQPPPFLCPPAAHLSSTNCGSELTRLDFTTTSLDASDGQLRINFDVPPHTDHYGHVSGASRVPFGDDLL